MLNIIGESRAYRAFIEVRKIAYCSFGNVKYTVLRTKRNGKEKKEIAPLP